jgi:hypothetical protein
MNVSQQCVKPIPAIMERSTAVTVSNTVTGKGCLSIARQQIQSSQHDDDGAKWVLIDLLKVALSS